MQHTPKEGAPEIRKCILDYLEENGKTKFSVLKNHLSHLRTQEGEARFSEGSIIGALRTAPFQDENILKWKEGAAAFYDLSKNRPDHINNANSIYENRSNIEQPTAQREMTPTEENQIQSLLNDLLLQAKSLRDFHRSPYSSELYLKVLELQNFVLKESLKKRP